MLSSTAEYALRAVLFLARQSGARFVRSSEVAEALEIPENYLSKILHELTRGGILTSSRGRNGGFRLSAEPGELPLLTVVSRFDRIGENRTCLLGRPECRDDRPCSAHEHWRSVAEQMAIFFRETTVLDLMSQSGEPEQ